MTLKRRITVFLIAALVIAAVVGVYYMPHWQQTLAAVSKGGRRGGPAANGPVPVLATVARLADVPVYLDGVGTAKALNTVTVRSQVDGKIMEVLFTEGQDVPKGSILAKIDPVTYQAAYDQTVAKKAQDEALARVRIEAAVAWRSLTKQQQQEIGSGLRSRFPSKHIVQIICGAFDTEGSGFARDIAKALRNANFDVPPPESLAVTRTGGIRPTDPITNIPTGVKVASAPERESIALAQAIVNELTSRGFDASMERPYGKRDTTNADWSDISIDVQARPEGPQGEFKLEAEREAKAKDKDKTKAKAKPE